MTDRQAEREAQARAWLISRGLCHKNSSGELIATTEETQSLVALLADRERAVLEEAAHKLAMGAVKNNGPFTIIGHVIDYLRQLAREVQP